MFKNKKEFFVWWIKNVFEANYGNPEAIYRKRVILVLFAYAQLRPFTEKEQFVGNIVLGDDRLPYYIDEYGAMQPLPIYAPDEENLQPWLKSDEKLTLTKDECSLVKDKVDTTYGEALMNLLLLGTTFGNKASYVTKPNKPWLSPDDFMEAFEAIPKAKDPTNPKEGEVTPREFWRFVQVLGWVQWMNPFFGVAATEDTLGVPKEVMDLATKRLAEAEKAGKLSDPVHMAKIEAEVVALDKKMMAGKPGAIFLKNSAKAYNVSRKRMFVMFGTEESIEGKGKVVTIKQPLSKGLDIQHLPEQANSMRGGIAGRGLGTALGGAGAKKVSRAAQDIEFNVDDCKTPVTVELIVTEEVVKYLPGRYLAGKAEPLTKDEANKLFGKMINLRSPIACKAEAPKYCKKCMGVSASRLENSAALQAMTKENVIMYHEMQKMHGRSLSVVPYALMDRLH